LTEEENIKQAIHSHFTEYFNKKLLEQIQPTSDYYQLYQPHPELEIHYQNLFDIISDEEWQNTIQNLPLQKAAGPLETNYEHIKYVSSTGQISLKLFINKCFQLQKIPSDWKTSNIFLIPKKSSWDFTLNQVHPISIIELMKKCFTKIFTQRLDHIINSNKLLSNLNFAATKNSSTHIPIQILNNTIEHYKHFNKEAWIMFQDMSKAFDKINISRLQDTCKRIGIPIKGIQLITELHTNRQARIITAHGLTSPVHIKSGIEQGETYSPLLWKIYYDPILTYIHNKYKNHLLKITSSSPLEIVSNIPPSSITIPPMAFMDDTVWHSKNPETLQCILNDTQQLYNLNNIEINAAKSDLLYISQNKNKLNNTIPMLYYNNQIIPLRKPHEII